MNISYEESIPVPELEEAERIKRALNDEQVCADISAVLRGRNRLREILLEVIDDGDEGMPWGLDHPFSDVANEQRLRFCDAVERKSYGK